MCCCSHNTALQVGCYYICTGQHEVARRHLAKATALDPGCAPAWLAYGHAFSLQDERDQVGGFFLLLECCCKKSEAKPDFQVGVFANCQRNQKTIYRARLLG